MKKLLLLFLVVFTANHSAWAETVETDAGYGEWQSNCLLKTGNSSFRFTACRNVTVDMAAPLGLTVRHEMGNASFYTASYAWQDDRSPSHYLASEKRDIENLSHRSTARVYYLNSQRQRITGNHFGIKNVWECYQQIRGDKITLCVWQKP